MLINSERKSTKLTHYQVFKLQTGANFNGAGIEKTNLVRGSRALKWDIVHVAVSNPSWQGKK